MEIPIWAYFALGVSLVFLFSGRFKPLGLAGLISIALIVFTFSVTTPVQASPGQLIFIDETELTLGLMAQEATSNQTPVTVIPAQPFISVDGKPSKNPADYPLNMSTPCEVNSSYSAQVLQWCGLITYYAKDRGLDPNFIAAVITQESGGDPETCDVNGHMVIDGIPICGSAAGAIGLMQIMPSDGLAAEIFGSTFSNRRRSIEYLDAEINIATGTTMLAAGGAATDPRESLIGYGGDYNTEEYNFDKYYYADKVMSIYNSHQ